jgi:hypothetical protein
MGPPGACEPWVCVRRGGGAAALLYIALTRSCMQYIRSADCSRSLGVCMGGGGEEGLCARGGQSAQA